MSSADSEKVLEGLLGLLVCRPRSHAVDDRLCEVRVLAVAVGISVVLAFRGDLQPGVHALGKAFRGGVLCLRHRRRWCGRRRGSGRRCAGRWGVVFRGRSAALRYGGARSWRSWNGAVSVDRRVGGYRRRGVSRRCCLGSGTLSFWRG